MLFFFNDTATTEIYTLSLHDALPICFVAEGRHQILFDDLLRVMHETLNQTETMAMIREKVRDRKSTRLNSSHANISYAVFCLKKKRFGRGHGARRHQQIGSMLEALDL